MDLQNKFAQLQRGTVVLELAMSHGDMIATSQALQIVRKTIVEIADVLNEYREKYEQDKEQHREADQGRNEAA